MKNKRLISLALGLLPAVIMGQDLDLTPAQQKLVDEIPADKAERAQEIFTALGEDAKELVPMFASKLTTEKSDADTTARYALGGLVWTIGKSGSEAQKQELANLIADAIESTEGTEPKSFLVEQLQYLAVDSISPKLYPLMTDKELGSRAIRTLTALRPEGLADKMVAALADAPTTETRAGLLQSLAQLAPKNGVEQISTYASDSDAAVKEAALDALAAIGDPKSRATLKAAAEESATFYEQLGAARYLDYALSLAKNNQADLAVEVSQDVLKMEHTTATVHLKGLALTALTDIQKNQALDTLFQHVTDDEEDVRAIALRNINRFEDAQVTARVLEELQKAPDQEVTLAILLALGDRGDASALPAITALFANEDAAVATAAIAAAGEIDRSKALSALIEALKAEQDKAVIDAIVAELRRVKSEQLVPAVAGAIASAETAGKVALIELLGERRASTQKEVVFTAAKSEDAKVRSAAYDALGRVAEAADLDRLRDMMLSAESSSDRNSARKAFVAAARESGDAAARSALLIESFEAATPAGKEALLDAMAALADKQTLQLAIDTASTSETPALQDAAVRALSAWQSQDAAPALLDIAQKSKEQKHQVLAVRGYARLAGEVKDAPEQQIEMFRNALKFAKRDEEKKTILSQLGDIKTTEALKLVGPYVDREGVKAEAAAAAVKIALPKGRNDTGIRGAVAADILERALPAITDEKQHKEVRDYIYSVVNDIAMVKLPEDSEGFGSLFNGTDLSGWCGDTDGYAVEDGVLVCKAESGGKLFSEKQFGDYVLRFEFKMPAGANNGVGIRTPIAGDPAYSGMEVQILDDKDEQYKDIKDWQRHGSVYGIAPSQGAELKIGEWNTEEISVIGRNIKVTVNGKVVTEVNLDEAEKAGFPSGKEHPGVKRNRGHIGFLGHGHKVEFRNIRIKNVANEAVPEGFTNLFNGENLDGWKGLVANPIKRKEMTPEVLKQAQAKADEEMEAHWEAINDILYFDGEGSHMCTIKDYGNFEMLVDWCIVPYGDNGIYLRGTPQVQIWDPAQWPVGSGGLYNNKEHTSNPLVMADNPIGQWNTFRIKMIDDKVTVHLNDKLVVDNVVLENYWDRKSPIFPVEQIELQSHGSPAWFRNIYIKELP